ncbi:MAG: CcmD family protein [Chitinophagales bacterium]|nr:CcmD family protein [Chitinophagales bacterium]
MKKIISILLLTLYSIMVFAQDKSIDQEASDFLRNSYKLYVVITILITIFAGIIIFLIFQDRKISKLEKKFKDRSST